MTQLASEMPRSRLGVLARTIVRRLRVAKLRITSRGRVTIDETSGIARRSRILPTASGSIGPNVLVGTDFRADVPFDIGAGSLISSSVAFIGKDHDLGPGAKSVAEGSRLAAGRVVLAGDNLVGYGSIMIAPCSLAHGVVVGAGSVVTGDLDQPDGIYGGVPARLIGSRER